MTISQNTPRGPSALTGNLAGVQVLQSYWFIKSEQFGKLSVGKQSQPSDNTAILVDGSGSLVPANWVAFDVNGFFLRSKITGKLTNVSLGFAGGCHGMGGAWGDCNVLPESVVRYDTPVFVGFSASASWGENDVWDVAARYSGTFSDFKAALAAAYAETNDPGLGAPAAIPFLNLPNGSLRYFQAGAYAEHVPTGLFLYGAYGHLKVDDPNPFFATAGLPLDAENYYVKGGIRQNWTSLGHTVLYGEYLRNTDGILNTAFFCQAQEFQPHPSLTSGVWASFRKSMQQRCHYGSSTGMRDSMLMHFKMV